MDPNTLEVTEQPEVFAFTSIRELVNETLQKDFGKNLGLSGVSSGFKALDAITGGFQKGQLVTVAVRPGMGKTAFLLSVANNLAIKNNYSVAIFSAERSSQKMTNRIIESETGMSLEKLQKASLKASERDHMLSLVSGIAKASIFLDDTPSLTIEALVRKCGQLKLRHKADLIIIDYLELISSLEGNFGNRAEELSVVVKGIKEMAAELNIPVLLFSQIPSAFPGFGQPRPDIRDVPVYLSEHSDTVLFLHRSDLVPGKEKTNGKAHVELVVAKHNDPERQVVLPLAYIESIAKFTDLS